MTPRPVSRMFRPMSRPPRHALFLARANEFPPGSIEIVLGEAVFDTLRLLDVLQDVRAGHIPPDWLNSRLDDAARSLPRRKHQFETAYLRLILEDIRGALRSGEVYHVWTGLFGLSVNLQDRERWDEMFDVLETAWALVDASWPACERLAVAYRLGAHYARRGRASDAERLYRAAAHGARAVDRRGLAAARAELFLESEPRLAETRFRRLLRKAARSRDRGLVAWAASGIAEALLAQHRYAEAARFAWQAHQRSYGRVDRSFSRFTVGRALEGVGALRAACCAFWAPALGCTRLDLRWRALAALVRVLSRRGDRVTFEQWRGDGERRRGKVPSPTYELEFVIELARGLARFGAEAAARKVLSDAHALAQKLSAPPPSYLARMLEEPLDTSAVAPATDPPSDLPAAVRAIVEQVEALRLPDLALFLDGVDAASPDRPPAPGT